MESVEHCFSIFTYGLSKAQELFDAENCPVHSLLDFPTLLETATNLNYINADERDLIDKWQQGPFAWGENNGFPRIERES